MKKKIDLNNFQLEEIDGYTLAMFLADNRENDIKLLHLGLNHFNNECLFDILSTL
jgi:hypothetical protein